MTLQGGIVFVEGHSDPLKYATPGSPTHVAAWLMANEPRFFGRDGYLPQDIPPEGYTVDENFEWVLDFCGG
jgi:hypothetical protein